MAQIIDGKEIAKKIRAEVKERVPVVTEKIGVTPGLTVILVGEDPASEIYVRNKDKACKEAGINSVKHDLPADTKEEELLDLIDQLNVDNAVHGILVQLPLPDHINEARVLQAIDPKKDVDGFHPENVGLLVAGKPQLQPCTPYGVMKMLEYIGCDVEGKDAVIVGRSNIVGKPQAMMLLHKSATVTVCHSRTKNLEEKVKGADIVVAAVGRPKFVKGEWIKEGAIVIDVGINRTDEGLVGDVDFEEASKRASYITPVPGGVGPMTIAMLLNNTLEAALLQNS